MLDNIQVLPEDHNLAHKQVIESLLLEVVQLRAEHAALLRTVKNLDHMVEVLTNEAAARPADDAESMPEFDGALD
jgi:hypothetical protein